MRKWKVLVFIFFYAFGAFSIYWVGQSAREIMYGIGVPVGIITLYAVVMWAVVGGESNRPQGWWRSFANSLYYMGFLFTLTAIIVSLIAFEDQERERQRRQETEQTDATTTQETTSDEEEGSNAAEERSREETLSSGLIATLIVQNGYALSSTIWGLLLRIAVVQFREKPASGGQSASNGVGERENRGRPAHSSRPRQPGERNTEVGSGSASNGQVKIGTGSNPPSGPSDQKYGFLDSLYRVLQKLF